MIYDLVDDVKAAASGLLSEEFRENFIAIADPASLQKVVERRQPWRACLVTRGAIARRSAGWCALLRDNVVNLTKAR